MNTPGHEIPQTDLVEALAAQDFADADRYEESIIPHAQGPEDVHGTPLHRKVLAGISALAISAGSFVALDSMTSGAFAKSKTDPSGQSAAGIKKGEVVNLAEAFLPTLEKTPNEVMSAHIRLDTLAETTLDTSLLPYVCYEATEADPYFKTTLGVMDAVREGRDKKGPVGITVDSVQTTAVLTAGEIQSTNLITEKIVGWDNEQSLFVEKTIRYNNYKVLHQKQLGGKTVWTLYQYNQVSPPELLATRVIGREEAFQRMTASYKELKAVKKQLKH